MSQIIYQNKVSYMQKFFAFGLTFTGLGLIINHYLFFGILFILIGLFVFASGGLEVKTQNNTYRKFLKIFGLHIGKWVSYPEIEYISVVKSRILEDDYPQNKTYTEVFNINLFHNENKHFRIYQNGDKIETLLVAENLKSVLNVSLFDAT